MSGPRSGWAESLGDGVRRDHRVSCPSTADRRRGRRCGCPYSFWIPDRTKANGQRRVRIGGDVPPSAAKRTKQQLVVEARCATPAGPTQTAPVQATPNDDSPAGTSEEPAAMTVREWARRCFKVTWRDLSPHTRQTREVAYRLRIDPHLGHLLLMDVSPLVVEEWLAALTVDGVTRAIEKAAECLRTMLAVAVNLDVLEKNPVRTIPRTPKNALSRRGTRVLSEAQYAQLKAACNTNAERALVRVATECGLRCAELCALRWSDVDFEARRIRVTRSFVQTREHGRVLKDRKNGQPASPAMHESLVQLLRDLHVEAIANHGATEATPVWPGRGARGGAPDRDRTCTPGGMTRRVRRLVERAGLVDDDGKALATAHDLRRTGASLAIDAGEPVTRVQHQLGHSTPRTTIEFYARRTDEAAQDRYAEVFED